MATYLCNRTPHSSLGYKTPYEAKTGQKPDISEIKIFGSLVYRLAQQPKKLDPRGKPYYLVGYMSPNIYRILDPIKGTISISRDIETHEGIFYKNLKSNPNLEARKQELDLELEEDIKEITRLNELLRNKGLINTTILDPISYKQAILSPNKEQWIKAMDKEIKTLEDNRTWALVPRPKNKPIITGRWVYKTKLAPDSSISSYKARYVARGFLQQYGVNYFDTFAGTLRSTTYRALIALALRQNWTIRQWDIVSAFPNAEIDTEIYMEQPEGYSQDKDLVCLLNKALYGLKQAGRQWLLKLTSLLDKLGFISLKTDITVFIHQKLAIIIAVYVDDLLVLAKNIEIANSIYKELEKVVKLKDLGSLSYYLGIEVIPKEKGLVLTQRGYTRRLLERFDKENFKERLNPSISGEKLEKYKGQATLKEINSYQQQIGAIIYLSVNTRPDIAYKTALLSRFMSNPSPDHFRALNNLWAYLKATIDYGLVLGQSEATKPLELIGYSDSDWGGDITSRQSTTGYLFYVNNSLVSWVSKLQPTTALSSCEAEYTALKEATKEALFIRSLILELPDYLTQLDHKGLARDKDQESRNIDLDLNGDLDTNILDKDLIGPIAIYTDSQSAISLAKNPIFHNRTKHIDIQYHFVRENMEKGLISLKYHPTESLVADGLTKAIPNPKFNQFVKDLGIKGLRDIKA